MNPATFQNPMGMMPQQQPAHVQLKGQVLARMRQHSSTLTGWQSTLGADARTNAVWQLYSLLRLARPGVPDSALLNQAMQHESGMLSTSQSKEEYLTKFKAASQRLTELRAKNADQASMAMQPNNSMAASQMGMMHQTPMQATGSNQGQNAFHQPYPAHLQHQMQASPLPMTQNPSSTGMDNSNIPSQVQQQGMQQPQPNLQFGPEDQQKITEITRQLRQRLRPEDENRIRTELQSMPIEKRQALEQRNIDPIMWRLRQNAMRLYAAQKRAAQTGGQMGQQPNQGPGMAGRGMPNPMMQRTPQMGNTTPQQNGMGGGAEFDYAQLTSQQADAVRSAQAGHDVVPASNNPGMGQMGGFNAMAGGQPGQMGAQGRNPAQQPPGFNIHQAQRDNAIRQIQAQAQAQAQAARAQGMTPQQLALMGQRPGFNMPPGGPQNTAGMSLLTRPMMPPGPGGNGTPQPRPPQAGGQMPPQNFGQGAPGMSQAARALQEAHMRAAAAQTQLPGGPITARASLIPANVPGPVRQKMLEVPEDQFRALLTKWFNANGNRPPFGPNANMSQPGAQMGPQQGNPGGMSMMGPNANMPPFMQQGQMQNGMNNPQMQQVFQHEMMARPQNDVPLNPQIVQQMDTLPYPPPIADAVRQSMPENIRSWGQLKEWVSRNPNPMLPMEKLTRVQRIHYEKLSGQQQNNAANLGMPNGHPNGPGQLGPGHPNGQAPQAPMMPAGGTPNPGMQQRMAAMQAAQRQRLMMAIQQVSAADIQRVRQQYGPRVANASDDHLRQQIATMRLQQQQKAMGQPNMPGMPPQPPNMGMPQGPNMQQPPRVPQPGQPQPAPQMSGQQPQGQAKQAPQPKQPGNATPKVQPQQGLKRPSSDDVVEVADPSKPQAPPMQPSQSQQRPLGMTQAQFEKLTPQQQQVLRQKQMAIQAAQAQTQNQGQGAAVQGAATQSGQEISTAERNELTKKFMMLLTEVSQSVGQRPVIEVPPEAKAAMAQKLRAQGNIIQGIDKFMLADYVRHRDDKRTKNIIMVRHLLFSQLDGQRQLREQVTIEPANFEKLLHNIDVFMRQVAKEAQNDKNEKNEKKSKAAETAQADGAQPQAQPSANATQGPQSKLSHANLQAFQDHQAAILRRPQSGSKPPAAPTSSQPPFSFSSPHGTPVYPPNRQSELTPEKLKLPAKKKQRTSADSTPAQGTPIATSSPQIGKLSPELRRDASQPGLPAKPRFSCPHQICDFSARGFETKEELDGHMKEQHAKIEDPLQFAVDSVAEGLGLNADGSSKAPKVDAAAANRSKPMSVAKAPALAAAKTGQTPIVKAEAATPVPGGAAATPMNRVPTQTGIKSSPSANFKTPQAAGIKTQTPGSGSGAIPMHRTPSKLGVSKDIAGKPVDGTLPAGAVDGLLSPPKDATAADPWRNCPLSPKELSNLFDFEEDILGEVCSMPAEQFVFQHDGLTPTTTPSPADTDKSATTATSDISENDKLNIKISAEDGLSFDQWKLESDMDFSRQMDKLFMFDEASDGTTGLPEMSMDMGPSNDFWRDRMGDQKKIPGWSSEELEPPFDFLNAPIYDEARDVLFGLDTAMIDAS
ncbi:uncharacterized protein K452DRAFT_300121 [Aplosporella prunicola CBS 121167]|uniref:Mediator complex subunit 15 KIX domain-containing protein n=1 Tax=Aplosporella prunicola CBS 121167 TaxID=1176127 RepID=A0A6A6B8P3_9PEZI|nr:uncharacterized protein K452DRAFT_300121 [Aplosporella prunicola CBS 121167]KAF2139564.1 hypothetical protein K452DRAFT_300121 [Aplosporella prunicola CBS 121167]